MTKFKCNLTLEDATDIQFTNLSGTNTGKIESDGDDLVLSNAVGDILLGDGASDIYIGNGTDVVDILFEVSGSLSAESGAALTLGGAGGTLALGSAISSAATILGNLTIGVDDTGHDVTFFGATSGKKMLWDQSADTLVVDGTLDVNGDATVITGAGSGSLTVGRNANENMVIYVDDSNTTITGVQDSDTNSAHSFILNRTFLGSGANNFIIQKGGTAQLTLDTSGNATFAGNIIVSGTVDGIDVATRDAILTSTTTTAGAALPKAGGAMTGAITTNSTFDGVDIATRDAVLTSTTTTANAALPKAGGTMSGAIAMGSQNITGGGTITGTTLTGTSLDINGAADISGATNFGGDVTLTSAGSQQPLLTLKTTHTTKTASGELQFLKDAADTEDGENLGIITFYGEDEGNNNTKFAHIKGSIHESTNGQEGGSIKLAVAAHDGEMINGLVINDGDAEDEIDVTIGSTITSMTTVAGNLTVNGDADISGNLTGVDTLTAATLSVTDYGLASGDIPNNAGNTTGTAAGLSATLAIASGGTAATNSNGWLNSRITTSANGSLNYDATSAVAVNHDSLAGFEPAEHVDWAASGAGTIHASNYIENVVGNLGVTANGTSLTVTTTNGTNIAIPAATAEARGIMTPELVAAISANTAKETNEGEPDAEEGTRGIIALATVEEATGGSDEVKAVTAAGLKAHVESRKVHELAAPTAALAMNSQKITGVANPTAAQDVATKAYVDGARVQQIVNLKGYATLQNDVYDYANPYNTDDEAPFQFDVSYGSGTINSSTEVSQSKLFRSGGFHVPFACTVSDIQAQLTCNNDGNVSIALVEYRPSDAAGDTSDYPRVVYETVVVDSANNNNKVSSTTIATGDLDNTAIPAGSHLMIMVKGDGTSAGGTAVFSVAIGLSW